MSDNSSMKLRKEKKYPVHFEPSLIRDIEKVIAVSGDSKRVFFREAVREHLERQKKVHGIK